MLLLIDFYQTVQIARNPSKWYEKWNIFLRGHPSVANVCLYFGLVICVNSMLDVGLFVTGQLYVLAFCSILLSGMELAAVVNNYRIGDKL